MYVQVCSVRHVGPRMVKLPEQRCPQCGQKVPKGVVGRPRLDIPVHKVLGALSKGQTVTQTAKKFEISRGSVYRIKNESRT